MTAEARSLAWTTRDLATISMNAKRKLPANPTMNRNQAASPGTILDSKHPSPCLAWRR